MSQQIWTVQSAGSSHRYIKLTREDLPRVYQIAAESLAQATAQMEKSTAQMIRLREQVREAGLDDWLQNLENPPKPPKPEPRVRVKVLKGIRFTLKGYAHVTNDGYLRFEPREETYEAGAGSVIEISESDAKAFVKAGRVVVVPTSTPFEHHPALRFELADL